MKWYGNLKVTLVVTSFVIACTIYPLSATVSTFEELPLAAESYWNGSDGTGGFQSGQAYFHNTFFDFGGGFTSWDGWAYSNITDNTTAGYGNQYGVFAGGGVNRSSNYGVSYIPLDWMTGSYDPIPSRVDLVGSSNGYPVSGVYITNTTYAALSMLEGDDFVEKFGGETGDDPDWFKLMITGIGTTAAPVEFYLADYRFTDNSQDYVVEDWVWVDLSSLGEVTGLEFSVTSSDVGDFGINTPTYFAMDELTVVPEPMSILLLGLGGLVVSSKKAIGKNETHFVEK